MAAALEGQVRDYDRRGPAHVAFRLESPLDDLPQEVELVIYRVAQEALANAARHAGASRIDVSLDRADSLVMLVVSDDGSELLREPLGQHDRGDMREGCGSVGHD